MGGLSIWHLLILLAIVLLVFGPSRLGDLGKSLGEAIRGFKKGMNEEPEIDVTNSTRREQIREGEQGQASASKQSEKDKA